MSSDSESSWMHELVAKYEESTSVRTLVQLIPYVGGALDLVLSSHGQKFRRARLESYLGAISAKIGKVEQDFTRMLNESPEEVYDLLRSHLEESDRTRDNERREQFANILLNQATRNTKWDEPETATRLLRTLTSLHVAILKDVCSAPICDAPFEGLRVSVIEPIDKKDEPGKFHVLAETFGAVPGPQLRLAVIELVSSGLIKDEGVGRFGAMAMEKFSPLPTASWLLGWIESP
ncbi:MAG: hypothetical protein JST16_02970 [Bdellovibrionales bacterium]|nr:hypothetical protein [Bdellovibrionales bacterium]